LIFLGSVVDVGQLISQLSRSEKSLADSERQLAETTKKLNDLKDSTDRLASGKEKLQVQNLIIHLCFSSFLSIFSQTVFPSSSNVILLSFYFRLN